MKKAMGELLYSVFLIVWGIWFALNPLQDILHGQWHGTLGWLIGGAVGGLIMLIGRGFAKNRRL